MADNDQLPSATVGGSAALDAPAGGVTPVTPAEPSVTPVKMVPEADLNKLRSTLDRQNAELRNEAQALKKQLDALQQQATEARLKDMTPDERAVFELEQEQTQIEQERLQLQQQQYAAANARYIYELQTYYLNQGVPYNVLQGLTDPAEMQDAMIKYFKSPEYLKSGQSPTTTSSAPAAKTPPPVTTNTPAAVGTLSWKDFAVGSPEEAKLFKDIEAGRVNPKDIKP